MKPAPSRHRDYARRFEIAPAPAKDYLSEKKKKKKSAKTAAWFLIFFFLVFAMLMAKVATSNSWANGGLPDSDTAYDVARQYIMPTARSRNVDFADDDYKFAKQSDSVYVIKSSYTTKFNNGVNQTRNFTIILKYKGGMAKKIGNWDLIDLDHD